MPKKNLVSKVDALLEGMIGRLEKLEKVAVEQFPEICKEIIAERKVELENEVIMAGVGLAVCAVIASFGLPAAFSSANNEAVRFIGGILGFISTVAMLPMGGCFMGSFLKIRELNAAPKLYVINRLRRMISK